MPRIDRLLSQTGFWSRKQIRELIKEGRVLIGDEPVLSPSQEVTYSQLRDIRLFLEEEIDGRVLHHVISNHGHAYLMLNKPKGYLSTTELEAEYPSFLELLTSPLDPEAPRLPEKLIMRLSSAGRLDVDTRGLLLVTTDGELIHRVTHPRWGLKKRYVVEVEGPLELIGKLTEGVDIGRGEVLKAEDVKLLKQGSSSVIELTLTHGPYRGIRRALKRIGLKVLDLRRVAIGPIELGDLREGCYRFLTSEEIESLRSAIGLR